MVIEKSCNLLEKRIIDSNMCSYPYIPVQEHLVRSWMRKGQILFLLAIGS